ncbi:Flp family type IVb pilin [Agrobacterium vitis]|nr:Flp family type IVb pilin [Allorhizobium ampelinum]
MSGATAIEYSLIAGIIAVTLYLALGVYYDALDRLFDSIIAAIPQA